MGSFKQMKYKLRTYFHNTTQKGWFLQLVLIPSICLTRNNKGSFIETGAYGDHWALTISFLVWDFGIIVQQEL